MSEPQIETPQAEPNADAASPDVADFESSAPNPLPSPSLPLTEPPHAENHSGPTGRTVHRRRRRRKRHSQTQSGTREGTRLTSRPWFIFLSFVLALGFAGWLTYFMWMIEQDPRRTASRPATARLAEEPVSSFHNEELRQASEMVSSAFQKLADGDNYEAYRKFKNIYELYPNLPGTLHMISRLAARLDMKEDADRVVLEAQKLGRHPGEVALLLAQNAVRLGRAENMPEMFERAHHAAPFDSNILHLWGDALREVGKNREAEEKFAASLIRASSGSAAYLTEIKLRLTRLEIDPANQRQPAIDAALGSDPDGATFLLAAAAGLVEPVNPAEFERHAAFLREARLRIPAPLFAYLMKDPIFQSPDANQAFGELIRVPMPRGASSELRYLP